MKNSNKTDLKKYKYFFNQIINDVSYTNMIYNTKDKYHIDLVKNFIKSEKYKTTYPFDNTEPEEIEFNYYF